MLTRLVIFGVFLAVLFELGFDLCLDRSSIGQVCIRLKIQDQGLNFSAQEVIGTRGTQRSQFTQILTINEFEDALIIGKMTDHPFVAGAKSSEHWRQSSRLLFAVFFRQTFYNLASEDRTIFTQPLFDIVRSLFDDFEAINVALIRGISPGEQAMSTQYNPANTRVFLQAFL